MKRSYAVTTDTGGLTTRDIGGTNMIASDDSWTLPTLPIELSRDDVHLWRLEINQPNLEILRFTSVLSAEERVRAKDFRFERHKVQFIVTRGALRRILSFYLKTEPDQLKFCYDAYGKPHLPRTSCNVQFNVAHSRGLALYALTRGRNVGVDLEYIHYIPDFDKAAVGFLSKRENAAYRKLPSTQKLRVFFECWTMKEAYSKAIGTGLGLPFDQLDMLMKSKDSTCTLDLWKGVEKASRWSVASLVPAPGYTAALVVEGHDWHLHRFQFGTYQSQLM